MGPLSVSDSTIAQDPTRVVWDAIIVGTGIGGATLGYALAKAGKRVLFCERGWNNIARSGALTAEYPEQYLTFDLRPCLPMLVDTATR